MPLASRYRSVTDRLRRRKGASAGGVSSGPAAPPLRRAPGGASGLATVLEQGHLEPVAHEDLDAAGDAAGEAQEGEHGSPTGLDAPAPPAQLLGVDAEGSGHAAPAEAAGLLEPHDALGEVLRQDAALYGQRQVVGGGAMRGPAEAGRVVEVVHCYSSNLNRSSNPVIPRALSIRRRMRPEGERPLLTSIDT